MDAIDKPGRAQGATSRPHRESRLNIYGLLKVLLVVAVVCAVLRLVAECFERPFVDMFYMVTSGRWMLENHSLQTMGISSPVPMRFVSHNWLFCLFATLCLNACEALGLGWYGMSALSAVMSLCVVAYAVVIARKVTGGSHVAQLLTALTFLSLSALTELRAQVVVLALTIYCLWANWRYGRTGDLRPLLLVPVFTIVHSNIQSATVLSEPLVCLGYAATYLIFPTQRGRRVALAPFAVGLASIAAAFVNPYGVAAITYPFVNAGVAGYRESVVEMQRFLTVLGEEPLTYVWYVAVPVAVIGLSLLSQSHARQYHVAEDVMAVVGVVAIFPALRNQLYTVLLCWWLAVVSWGDMRSFVLHVVKAQSPVDLFALGVSKARSAAVYLTYALVMALVLAEALGASELLDISFVKDERDAGIQSSENSPKASADFIERDSSGRRPRVLTVPNFGSYLEYRGFVVNCTSRWETWEPAISGVGEHFFYDTIDGLQLDGDREALDRLLSVTEWDYVIVDSSGDDDPIVRAVNRLGEFEPVFTEDLRDDGSLKAIVYRRVRPSDDG